MHDRDIAYYSRSGGVLAGFGKGFVRYVVEPAPVQADPRSVPPSDVASGQGAVVSVAFEGAREVQPSPQEPIGGTRNFFLGSDASAWRRAVPSYGALVYREAWPGIDLVYRATDAGPKYEVVVSPVADLSAVAFTYSGADSLEVAADGSLVARTAGGPLTDSPPVASSGGSPVDCAFELRGPATVGFSCPSWDGTAALVVDPLVFSTYLGGSSTDYGRGVRTYSDGSVYVGGYTQSSNFPSTAGVVDPTANGGYDFFISKFDSSGSLLWSTYLGGSLSDYGYDLFVDSAGDAYIAGYVQSSNFPVTPGAAQASHSGGTYDMAVAKVDSTGSTLVFSTYLGGTSADYGQQVAVGANDTVFVTGYTSSTNFPITSGAFQTTKSGTYEAFIARFNQTGALLNSTYLGGNSNDYGYAVRTDGTGLPVVTGITTSSTFPVTSNAAQSYLSGGYDVFVARLDANLTALSYSTYLGGSSSDYGYAIAISGGVAYVTGYTTSNNWPTAGNSLQSSGGGLYDAFLFKVNLNTGGLLYSSFIGGSSYDYGYGVAVNSLGEAVLTGYTQSSNFPTTTYRDQQNLGGNYDTYILRLNAAGSALVYGSYIGGSSTDYGYAVAVDSNGTAYVTGYTSSNNFPTTPGAYDTTLASGDSFLYKIEMRKPRLTITTEPPGLWVFNQNDNVSTPFVDECTTLRRISVSTPQYFGDVRYVFDRWSNGGTMLHSVDCSLGDVSVVAYFKTEFAMNFTTQPAGLPLTIDGVQRNTPLDLWWENGTNHRISAMAVYTFGGVRYGFNAWSLGGAGEFYIQVNGSVDLVALYTITNYFVQAQADRPQTYILLDGNRYDGPLAEWLDAGSTHTLAAPALVTEGVDVRHTFTNWSDGGPLSRTFNVSQPLNLVAHFTTEYYTRLETSPPGISLDLDGVETATPYAAWWPEGQSHRIKGPFQLVQVDNTRYQLTGWVDSYAAERTVFADGPVTYTALFTPASYRTTVATLPAGLDVVLDRETFTTPVEVWWDVGTDHVVQAVSPQEGSGARYVFSGWSDHLQVTHVVTATGPMSLTARYDTEYRVVVDTDPPGLGILLDGVTGTAPSTVWWKSGQRHDIGVEPTQAVGANQRWDFDTWSDGGSRIHTVNVSGPTTFTARFSPTYLLTIDSAHARPPCDVADCWYRGGSTATFTIDSPQVASIGVRFAFVSWTGDYASANATASVLMDGPKKVTAIWALEYQLTVVSTYGVVEGAGWYAEGENARVTLEATEWTDNGTDYVFAGWTGASSSPNPQTTVSMDGPKTVTASWRRADTGSPGTGGDGGGSDGTGTAGGGLDAILVGGIVGAVAVAGVVVLLLMRRRKPSEDVGVDQMAAPAAAAPPAPPTDVQVSVPAAPLPVRPQQAPATRPQPSVPAQPKPQSPRPAQPAAPKPTQPKPPQPAPAKAPAPAVAPAPPKAPAPAPPVKPTCHSCGEGVEKEWSVCPFCEALLIR